MLDRLYSNPDFGVILLAVICVLVFLFLIVLFFGKKDEKRRKEMEKLVEEQKTENVQTTEEAVPPFKEIEQEPIKLEEVQEEQQPQESVNAVLNEDLEESPVESKEKEPVTNNFDFDALAAEITKELETISLNEPEEEEPLEEVEEQPAEDFEFTPLKSENIEMPSVENEGKREIEIPTEKAKPAMPTVFSSVYLNSKEETKPEEAIAMPKPNVVKPSIELPKPIDLPKLNNESEEVTPVIEEQPSEPIFPAMEEEIYTLKK